MKVHELIAKLSTQDQDEEVLMQIVKITPSTRIIELHLIRDVACVAGGSIVKEDNKFYGVVIRSLA
jgi:hypothetical protein